MSENKVMQMRYTYLSKIEVNLHTAEEEKVL